VNGVRALALLALLAGCGILSDPSPKAPDPREFEAILTTARMLREIGLPDVAESECDYISENAHPSMEGVLIEAGYLAGDCNLDRGEIDLALDEYTEVARRFPGEKARASRMVAKAHLSLGKWQEALRALDEVGPDSTSEEKKEIALLREKILPVLRMNLTGASNLSRFVQTAENPDFRFDEWIARSPMHFSLFEDGEEHGRIRIRMQKEMGGGLWHAIPWSGSSFRLAIRFRIDAVDRREHQISGTFGIGNRKFLDDKLKLSDEDEDKLVVRIVASTHVTGEHRTRQVSLKRARTFERSTRAVAKTLSLLGDAPLDTWFKVVVEYSRELASLRARVLRSRGSGEDSVLSDSVIQDVPPFGQGPFYLFFGEEIGGGDRLYTMEVSVDSILFEAHEKAELPVPVKDEGQRRREQGGLHFLKREWESAARSWERIEATDSVHPWQWVFLRWKAWKLAGKELLASKLRGEMIENALEIRPGTMDALERYAKFDDDARSILPVLKKARMKER
jgi:hypothetical protein